MRTICFLLSLKVGVLGTICFLLLLMRYCFVHYLFCTFINTLVFSALFVLYFNYYVDVLRTICFLFELLGWNFAHYLFYTFTNTLVFCALFVFSWTIRLKFWALFVLYFNYYVGVLRTICFLFELLGWSFAHYLFYTFANTLVFCALFVLYFY